MGYKRLFIWVEGEDDVRFFNKVIKPILDKKYNWVEVIAYARMAKKEIDGFLRSIKAMKAEYIYVTDINDAPCITAKKQQIQSQLKNIAKDKIIVVKKEIESWYLAGVGDVESEKLKIRNFRNTDSISKECFDNLIPKGFDSKIDFMLEILKCFSIKIARQKNKSFRYFTNNYICCCKVNSDRSI